MLFKEKSVCLARLTYCHLSTKFRSSRSYVSSAEESLDTPNYPPIEDLSEVALKIKERQRFHSNINNLNTIEEKLFALNLPRYWGWEPYILRELDLPYSAMPFAKYVTRTHFQEVADTPFKQCISDIDPKDLINVVKSQVQEAILFEKFDHRYKEELELKVNTNLADEVLHREAKLNSLLNQINRIIIVNLLTYASHLINVEIDYSPRIEAFWTVGGFNKSERDHHIRTEKLERDDIPFEWKEEYRPEMEHWFQYIGSTILQLRSPLPLDPILENPPASQSDLEKIISKENRFSPELRGFEKKRRFGTSVPGFWASEGTNEFGLLSFHSSNHLLERPEHFGKEEHVQALHAQAILAGFGWLLGQASYQGFSTFNDITYPLVSQSVITDGQSFSFYAHQLNTTLMHNDCFESNKKYNLCYGTRPLKLFEKIDGEQFINWNDDVILKLIKLYLNNISERNYNMKPYLNETEMYLSQLTEDERRIWLHNQFLYMYSNRPRAQLPYEIFDWEWIYKVKFMTRHMDARRRPFELWKDPLTQRKYNEYLSHYIPKKLKDPKNPKQKNYNTYFPDVFK